MEESIYRKARGRKARNEDQNLVLETEEKFKGVALMLADKHKEVSNRREDSQKRLSALLEVKRRNKKLEEEYEVLAARLKATKLNQTKNISALDQYNSKIEQLEAKKKYK